MDPMARSNKTVESLRRTSQPLSPKSLQDFTEENINKIIEQIPADPSPQISVDTAAGAEKKETEPTPQESESKEEVKEELYTDIDLETFFITGKLEYTRKILNKIPVTFRLLTGDELNIVNESLFNKRDKAAKVAHNENATEVLAFAVTRYGNKDVSQLKYEDRVKFVASLPGLMISKLFNTYSIFERSVNAMMEDSEQLKN